ncbi:CorA family divalent cation transporter [Bacillus sp. JJ1562]|uniref:CorA family divalent cation transporter n=1 Tax=Bacillus sp. JJ1562 TaxID=3122960 RepID=UPI003001CC83
MHPEVTKYVTFLIVPFSYDKEYKEAVRSLNADYFQPTNIQTERLFEHVEMLVSSGNHPETIGSHFSMTQKARSKFGLPNKNDLMLTLQTKQEQYEFSIPAIELYLFETQVGFWVIKLGLPKNIQIETLIETIYYAKKLEQYEYNLSYTKKIGRDEFYEQNVHLGSLITDLSQSLEVSSYFEGKETPTHALVYSSSKIDLEVENSSFLTSYLFQLRRSFKSTYKPSIVEKDFDKNPGLLPLFDNSYWGISLEGLANIVTKTDDAKTEEFFQSSYMHQIESTYFYIYILALHQKYALLRLSIVASKLSYDLQQVGEDNYTEQNFLISELRNQIVRFMLRSSYNQVTNITHYGHLYEMVRENLRISDLFRELHDELNALSSYTDAAEQRIQHLAEQEKKVATEKFNSKITTISIFFLPVTVITGFFGMNLDFITDIAEHWWILILSTLVVYLMVLLWIKENK